MEDEAREFTSKFDRMSQSEKNGERRSDGLMELLLEQGRSSLRDSVKKHYRQEMTANLK